MDLRAMTFNLRVNNKGDGDNAWPNRSNYVIETILENNPLVFGIQEGLHMMVSTLQAELSDYEMIGEGRGGGEVDEYSAIFYKKDLLTLKENGQFWLSETPEVPNSISWNSACTRVCTWGVFEVKADPSKKFALFNTHLDHVSQEAREKGVELICAHMNSYIESMPVIFMGDLNVKPENQVIANLKEAGLLRLKTEGRTFHNFEGGLSGDPIDYIFITENIQVNEVTVDRRDFAGKYPSDHYPVIAGLVI